MVTNLLLAAIAAVLFGLLVAIKAGFNELIAGLAALAAAQRAAPRDRDPVA